MEEAQPSTVGGDGAPTAMVAVPGLSGALTQGFPFLGGSGTVSMEASLRLRAKDYAAHDRWLRRRHECSELALPARRGQPGVRQPARERQRGVIRMW